jgi:hypothetical protein
MKSCWFKAVEGFEPECEHDCETCSYFLPDPPVPENEQDELEQDELPDFMVV